MRSKEVEENIIEKADQLYKKLDTKWLKDSKTNINKLTPISMKKMSQHQLASQGQVTEGATPLGIVEWLSAGAGTGKQGDGTDEQGAVPPVREQSMRLCTV